MKKPQIAIVCLLSVFVLTLAGTATAYDAAYEHIIYQAQTPVTVDGTYGTPATGDTAEWAPSLIQAFGTNGYFRDQWVMAPNVVNYLIETADDTDDAGDYWVICFDSTSAGGSTPPNGGAAPQTDDYKVVITGHGASATTQWYKGTGSAWQTVAAPPASAFQFAQSLSSSPKISAAHYIGEMTIDKADDSLGTVIMGYTWAIYIGYYDAHTGGYGLQSWPPSPATDTNPNSWGFVNYASDGNPDGDIPENFGFIAVALLSCFAVVVGTVIYRKHNVK